MTLKDLLGTAFQRVGSITAKGLMKDLHSRGSWVAHSQFNEIKSRNPLLAHGAKYFSQNDEDGILLEILRRIGCRNPGVFAEFGVGNGLENNTLILLASGWHGIWLGGQDVAFNDRCEGSRLSFVKDWITRENIVQLANKGLERFGRKLGDVSVASLDLDGNDIHFLRTLLANDLRPDVFVVEYNAKFPPSVDFEIVYDPAHRWQSDDYFGASLRSFVAVFSDVGYRLVACNVNGVNAFFVKNEFGQAFEDVPTAIESLYNGGTYFLYPASGHPLSPRTVERMISSDRAIAPVVVSVDNGAQGRN